MDFDLIGQEQENILTSSLCDTRDFTSSVDFRDDTHQQTSLSNQDTGYQTASLQSTNPESVSLHTNLTNQFGCLPFNVTNQESVFHTSCHIPANQDKPPVLNLTQHFSMIADEKNSDEEGTNFNTENLLSKQMFPKQKLLFIDDDEDTELDLHNTPKNTVPTEPKLDDSALPEDMSIDPSHMEVDSKLLNIDCVSTQEKIVLSRARQALAMANSLYPQDGSKAAASSVFLPDTRENEDLKMSATESREKKCSASK